MRYLLTLVSVLLLSCGSPTVRVAVPSDKVVTVEDLTAKTVRVIQRCKDGTKATGSGVVLKGDYLGTSVVATAAHVVKDPKLCNMEVVRANGDRHLVFRTKVDHKHDVALMYTLIGWHSNPVKLTRATLGTPVVAVGYPYDLLKKKPLPSLSRGEVVTVYDDWESTDEAYRISGSIMPGSSGGGAWNNKGELIGLTVSVMSYGFGPIWDHSYVTASEHLGSLL